MEENENKPVEAQSAGSEAAAEKELISIADFTRVELKVAQIMQAEKIETSEKLLRLQVDVGESEKRQIIAGIAKHYSPDELVGRKIIVVANLKPAKLMGNLSQGMLLAASDAHGNLALLSISDEMPAGASIR